MASTLILSLVLLAQASAAQPSVVRTELVGPLTGEGARLHPRNLSPHRIDYYGTDLGLSYEHRGRLHFLFGDTWATEAYEPIERSSGSRRDDGFGWLDLETWADGAAIDAANLPLIELGQSPDGSEMAAIDPGHAMDLGKTPVAGFSNGVDEFGIFLLGKPLGCLGDAQCGDGLRCDRGLGFVGVRYDQEEGFTGACIDGESGCAADPMVSSTGAAVRGSGLCSDPTSSVWSRSPGGRVAAVARRHRVAVRSRSSPEKYVGFHDWLTTKFVNLAVRVVASSAPLSGRDASLTDFSSSAAAGGERRIFFWGRPGFVGIRALGRSLGLYFGYADVPVGHSFSWKPRYFSGTDAAGLPQFSPSEAAAEALDLDDRRSGVQPEEPHDVTNQMSIVWIEELDRWVMFYGGGMTVLPSAAFPTCGVLQAFAGSECSAVVVGNGAVRMRTAEYPWGPWSPPQEVIVGGDAGTPGSGQYGVGGALHHPSCTSPGCAPPTETAVYHADEYGFFYGANIIEPWVRSVATGVELMWNVSTWDPYRVVLLRSRIEP